MFLSFLLLPVMAEEGGVSYDDLRIDMQTSNAELRKADEATVQAVLDVKDAKAAYQPVIELMLTGTYMANPPIDKITISGNKLASQLGLPTGVVTPTG